MHAPAPCPRCGKTERLRKREFSDQALAALIVWYELDRSVVGNCAICDGCYGELREILIDRNEELPDMPDLDTAIAQAEKPAKPSKTATAKAPAAKPKKKAAKKAAKKKTAKGGRSSRAG